MFWQKNRKLEIIRAKWGRAADKHRNFDLISSYFKLQSKLDKQKIVDEKTWEDLNFNSVFALLDRNISGVGQQYLYSLLHNYNNANIDLEKRSKLVEELKTNSEIRENIQLKLLNVNGVSSYFIIYLLLSKNRFNSRKFNDITDLIQAKINISCFLVLKLAGTPQKGFCIIFYRSLLIW